MRSKTNRRERDESAPADDATEVRAPLAANGTSEAYCLRMRQLRGRVLECRHTPDGWNAVLLATQKRLLVTGSTTVTPPNPGDIVQVEVSEDDRIGRIERLGGSFGGIWDPDGDVTRWRHVNRGATRFDNLWKRQSIIQAVRGHFYAEGFLEAQTPLLALATCPDLHIESFRVEEGWLVTSTEYHIKRMFVGGFERVFTLTQNFRKEEPSPRHNPEFTMLEWARGYEDLRAIERDAELIVTAGLRAIDAQATHLTYGGSRVQLVGVPWERLSVQEALHRHLNIQVDPDFNLLSLQAGVARSGIAVPAQFLNDARDLVTYLLDAMQPKLGVTTPTFLVDWPAFFTTSAALDPTHVGRAERSELFIAGVEIADGFPFLRDYDTQRSLFDSAQADREQAGKTRVTLDPAFLRAVRQGLPPGAGMALGFDRLVMVLLGADTLGDVIAFQWDER